MNSAEGVVQHLNYISTFPLLLNVSSEPTYFMALKDNAGLVKMYAMVNVRQYNIVATGQTVMECEREYERLLTQNGITTTPAHPDNEITGRVQDVRTAVLDGNSYYYFKLEGGDCWYVISASADQTAVIVSVGDRVSIYDADEEGQLRTAQSIEVK